MNLLNCGPDKREWQRALEKMKANQKGTGDKMNSDQQKFWEDWYYKNELHGGGTTFYVSFEKFIEAIKLAQEIQRKKDAIIALSHWAKSDKLELAKMHYYDLACHEISQAIERQE